MLKQECSQCNRVLDREGRYCKACHAAYQREWRKRQKEELDRLRELVRVFSRA